MSKYFKKRKFKYIPKLHWFSPELKYERNRVCALYKRYNKNRDNVNYKDLYTAARNEYKNMVKLAKKKSWRCYCENTTEVYGNLYKFYFW